jgi:2,4-dienoyl-CoA reductase (NADPH2)
MVETKYPHLFKPMKIGGLRLKNWITMAPLYPGYAAEGGAVSQLILYHYGRMAKSGAGLIVVENASVAAGDFPVGYRFLADEWLPDGLKPMESGIFARRLDEAGVAYISVMGGTYESFFLPEIVRRSKKPGYMADPAATVKKQVSVPVIAAGRIQSPALAESILTEKKADLIGLARVLWADPRWGIKARQGREAEIVACNPKCNARMELVMKGRPAFCPRWDKEEREASKELFV